MLLVSASLPPCGCSMYLAQSGTDLSKLQSREDVHKKLGSPIRDGVSQGETSEVFRTRRKIAEPPMGDSDALEFAITLGLSELYRFPQEIFRTGRRTILGQKFRVDYDASGKVSSIVPVNDYHPGRHSGWNVSDPLPTADSDTSELSPPRAIPPIPLVRPSRSR